MAIQDSEKGLLSPLMPHDESAGLDSQVAQLQASNAELSAELAALRDVERSNESLTKLVAQLREANQNLVLATVNAQGLRDDAETANHRQNEFLAMLAHELRNPLAPISMASAMLAKIPAPSAPLLNLQAIIQRQVLHLSRLLDDLLDAARISSGKISLLRRPMSLIEQIERAIETVQLRLQERSQNLELELPPEEIIVDGDPVRLAQVFSNLLANASKFTHNGGTIRVVARSEGGNAVVSIADNGAGIAPDVIPHIFTLFTQGPRSLARSEGGLGVGLNVVRNIMQLHGGEVEVFSAGLNRGSVFTVTLPATNQSLASSAAPEARDRASAHRILLIEDNVDANHTLNMLLTYEGHTVVSAFDGIAGLELAREHAYDILICDIGLPGIDGFELITELRKSSNGTVPFAVAISGYGQAEDRMRAIGSGFNQYFVKPVDVDALLRLIDSCVIAHPDTAVHRRR